MKELIQRATLVNIDPAEYLAEHAESYKTISVSTTHLTKSDMHFIQTFTEMVASRDTGFFMKLYEERELNLEYEGISQFLKWVIGDCHDAGYRMIEFDGDARVYACWAVHEW